MTNIRQFAVYFQSDEQRASLIVRKALGEITDSRPSLSDPFVKQNGFAPYFIGKPFAAKPRLSGLSERAAFRRSARDILSMLNAFYAFSTEASGRSIIRGLCFFAPSPL